LEPSPLIPQALFFNSKNQESIVMSEINNTKTAATVSAARLAANRQNAQKSCGPTTREGKAKSSLNAVKCGLTGNTVLFANEDASRYHAHLQSYETQFQPVGPEESNFVQSIADIRWRLNRIPGLELAILATGSLQVIEDYPAYAAPEAEMALELQVRRLHEKELRNLQLQENRLARRRERETAELQRLQVARKAKEEEALAAAAKASLLAEHRQQPLSKIPGVGFDFSEDRFVTYLSRLTPAQKGKFLKEALTEAVEVPQTLETAA
jgi:hypothetical protein